MSEYQLSVYLFPVLAHALLRISGTVCNQQKNVYQVTDMLLHVHPFEHVRYKQKEDSLVKTLVHTTTSSQKLKGYHRHPLDQSSYT